MRPDKKGKLRELKKRLEAFQDREWEKKKEELRERKEKRGRS